MEPTQARLAERFWSKVDQTGDCWLWTGGRFTVGYGKLWPDLYAHRVSYELHHGPIPDGMLIDHVCHVLLCVNPAHLRLADRKGNSENYKGLRSDNKSGYRGVAWNKRSRKWTASIGHRGKCIYLGLYDDPAEAAEVARQKRIELFTHNDADRTKQPKETP